jgi:tripartite-type tricarboxylate transporter receptor subunit TctC
MARYLHTKECSTGNSDRLNTALKAALNDPDVKKRLADSNIDVVSMDKVSASGLKTHLDNEINKWGPVIRKANIPD